LVSERQNPAEAGSALPNLTSASDGEVLLSWVQAAGTDRRVLRFAALKRGAWSQAATVGGSQGLNDKYREVLPAIVKLADGGLVAAWTRQRKIGDATAEDVHAAVSRDGGSTWSKAAVTHRDGSSSEHSFLSISQAGPKDAGIVWLDGREWQTAKRFQVRSVTVASDGAISAESVLDDDACTCCPTALAHTPEGLLAAYRDHASGEIRDISVVRQRSGRWLTPVPLHRDGWHISACPVNGPSLAAHGRRVAAAWYTGAGDRPTVKAAFSDDSGTTFGKPIEVDTVHNATNKPAGRAAVALLADGSATVAWIRHREASAELVAQYVTADGTRSRPAIVASANARELGSPKLATMGEDAVIVWTRGEGAQRSVHLAVLRRGR
jgi:hypothetical protein